MTASNQAATQPIIVETPIRQIGVSDLRWALRSGWHDFQERRGELIFVALLYPLIGLVTAAIALNGALLPVLFPIVAGLSLLGPVVAAGFYEMAKRREQGKRAGWSHFLDPLRKDRRAGMVSLMAMLIMIFLVWLLVAWLLYQATVGRLDPVGASGFVATLFGTREGWLLIVLGNAAGGAIAVVTLALTIVSVPMVVDQPVDASTAVRTSIRAIRANPRIIARWGAMVAGLLVLGIIPFFIGLAVVLPVLGYATWHLYTRLVVR